VKVRVELPSGEEGVPPSLVALELDTLDYQGTHFYPPPLWHVPLQKWCVWWVQYL